MPKILIVEDDESLSEIICDELKIDRHMTETAMTGPDADEKLQYYEFDLVILDWELPGGITGPEVCKRFRSRGGSTPVLMLTGKKAIQEKEAGFDAGADDYLTKPFEMRELSARVKALLRRPTGYTTTVLTAGGLTLDPVQHKVTRDGKEIRLMPKEFALLEFLMRHRNQVFSADALLNRVWASESDSSPESLRTCMRRLREKIDVEGEESVIRTLHGIGYKIEA